MLTVDYPSPVKGRVVVWGLLAHSPFGGMTWQVLHHLAGLRQLGLDVWYVEDSDRPLTDPLSYNPTMTYGPNVDYMADQLGRIGLAERWVFRPPGQHEETLGARDFSGLKSLYGESDAVFNLCGAQELLPWHDEIDELILLETDPVLNQIGVAQGHADTVSLLASHTDTFTYALNIRGDDFAVPVEREDWIPTRPPVVVEWWQTHSLPTGVMLTTVTNWDHQGKDVSWRGESWPWSKRSEFMPLLELPSQSALSLGLAVGNIGDSDLASLKHFGWQTSRSDLIADPNRYRAYIQESLGEFSVAKTQYVASRSGWFSDRSICYLAAGRPVILQDTGFSTRLPTGEGLLSFSNKDEALAAIDSVAGDYERHSVAAAEIARECFASDRVLRDVVSRIGIF